MRVYELAKELNLSSKELLKELRESFGYEIKSHFSNLKEEQISETRGLYAYLEKEEEIAKDLQLSDESTLLPEDSKEELTIDDKLSLGIFSKDDIIPPQEKEICEEPESASKEPIEESKNEIVEETTHTDDDDEIWAKKNYRS